MNEVSHEFICLAILSFLIIILEVFIIIRSKVSETDNLKYYENLRDFNDGQLKNFKQITEKVIFLEKSLFNALDQINDQIFEINKTSKLKEKKGKK